MIIFSMKFFVYLSNLYESTCKFEFVQANCYIWIFAFEVNAIRLFFGARLHTQIIPIVKINLETDFNINKTDRI